MNKIKYTFSLVILITSISIFSSCSKISESLQRDIIVVPDEVGFIIPKVTGTESGSKLGEIPITMDFDTLIRNQTSELGIANASNFKLTSVRLDIDTLDLENNFGNFENISVFIQSDTQPKTLVALLEANPNTATKSINIPLMPSNPELKGFLSSSAFKFSLTGKARTPTTVELNTKATLTYSLTVGF